MAYRTCDVKSSFHSSGEGLRIIVLSFGKSDIFKRLIYPLLKLRTLYPVQGSKEFDILPRLEISMDCKMLGDVSELSAEFLLILSEILTHELNGSEIGLYQIADHIHGGTLACAVRSEQSEHLSLSYLEIQIIHHGPVIIFLGQIDGF